MAVMVSAPVMGAAELAAREGGAPSVVASTQPPGTPTGIHLSFAGPGSITVMWSTRRPMSSSVRWAHVAPTNESAALTSQAGGSSVCPACVQYGGGSPMCQWHHTVLITGLRPGEPVTYQVGDVFAEVWSARLSFTAPEMAGSSTVTAAFFADMGWQSVSDVKPGPSNGSVGVAVRSRRCKSEAPLHPLLCPLETPAERVRAQLTVLAMAIDPGGLHVYHAVWARQQKRFDPESRLRPIYMICHRLSMFWIGSRQILCSSVQLIPGVPAPPRPQQVTSTTTRGRCRRAGCCI